MINLLKTICFTAMAACLYTNVATANQNYGFTELHHSSPLKATIFEAAGRLKNVDARLIYSIALVESNKNAGDKKNIKPDALVLRVPDKIYRADDENDACERLNIYADRYKNMVDVGLMQVNLKWNGHRVKDKCDLIHPVKNVNTGAQILREAIDSKNQYKIGSYHSSDPELGSAYEKRVLIIFSNLKKNGF